MRKHLLLWLAVCFCACRIERSYTKSTYTINADNLLYSLTNGYNAVNRPDSTVHVEVSFSLLTVNELNTKTEELSLTASFSLSWTDSSYLWVPASYSNIEYLFLTQGNCWRPQLIIDNAATDVRLLHENDQLLRAKYDGTISWEITGDFTVKCEADVTKFPYDKQKCFISLSNLVYSDTEVTLAANSSSATTDIISSSEWTILTVSKEKHSFTDGHNLPKSAVRFLIEFERNHQFYTWSLVVPYILLSCSGLLVFFIPQKNTDKIGFSTTVLLIVVVYFLMFVTSMPLHWESFPTTGVYFFLLMLTNILELVMTVVIVRMHLNDRDNKPVSHRLQRFAGTFLSRISCFACCGENDNYHSTGRSSSLTNHGPMNTRVSPSLLHTVVSSPSKLRHPVNGVKDFNRIKSASSMRTTSDIDTSTVTTESSNVSSNAPLELRITDYSWTDIIYMTNAFCFIMFSILFIFVTSICFASVHTS